MFELNEKPTGQGMRIAIVAARFNRFIVEQLLEGALDALERQGVADEDRVGQAVGIVADLRPAVGANGQLVRRVEHPVVVDLRLLLGHTTDHDLRLGAPERVVVHLHPRSGDVGAILPVAPAVHVEAMA